ncbi:hypothetical protein GGQ92_003094 [Gracilibacillus halotolerans]|uniref:Uncharacterized protein n=1 Tax=Gracilibacillus halotolerans TaxID=74386 RepID=A0A841RN61_9BACI|nr:hypothetical protein [Gracilibacillus halotolerans]MBB6514271.1 hypothetical protein [Gracilibacillus halotolerans]
MFGLSDLVGLVISAFIIFPTVIFLREFGYMIFGFLVGAKNSRITLGSGPRVFKIGKLDVRKYSHLYSWFSYDELRNTSKSAYVLLYAGPIMINVIIGLLINALLANDYLSVYETFWHRFVFYTFFYVLFDAVPMRTANGKPNNGMIIYQMIRYGKRTDYNPEPFLPSTFEMEKTYQKEMEKVKRTIKDYKSDNETN